MQEVEEKEKRLREYECQMARSCSAVSAASVSEPYLSLQEHRQTFFAYQTCRSAAAAATVAAQLDVWSQKVSLGNASKENRSKE